MFALIFALKELYADFVAISPHLFSLSLPNCYTSLNWSPTHLRRTVQGLAAVLLALKKFPVVRYQNSSDMARRLSEGLKVSLDSKKNGTFNKIKLKLNVQQLFTKETALFDFPKRTEISPLLLILDRRDDALTPLLNQVTWVNHRRLSDSL